LSSTLFRHSSKLCCIDIHLLMRSNSQLSPISILALEANVQLFHFTCFPDVKHLQNKTKNYYMKILRYLAKFTGWPNILNSLLQKLNFYLSLQNFLHLLLQGNWIHLSTQLMDQWNVHQRHRRC
jgi:hypothetical protein